MKTNNLDQKNCKHDFNFIDKNIIFDFNLTIFFFGYVDFFVIVKQNKKLNNI